MAKNEGKRLVEETQCPTCVCGYRKKRKARRRWLQLGVEYCFSYLGWVGPWSLLPDPLRKRRDVASNHSRAERRGSTGTILTHLQGRGQDFKQRYAKAPSPSAQPNLLGQRLAGRRTPLDCCPNAVRCGVSYEVRGEGTWAWAYRGQEGPQRPLHGAAGSVGHLDSGPSWRPLGQLHFPSMSLLLGASSAASERDGHMSTVQSGWEALRLGG